MECLTDFILMHPVEDINTVRILFSIDYLGDTTFTRLLEKGVLGYTFSTTLWVIHPCVLVEGKQKII
jgi:hypothetical protein